MYIYACTQTYVCVCANTWHRVKKVKTTSNKSGLEKPIGYT